MIIIPQDLSIQDLPKEEENQILSLPRSFGKCLPEQQQLIPLQDAHSSPSPVQEVENTAEIIEYALLHFSLTGTLKQDERGFLYIDLPDDFIYELYPLIHADGIELPPYFGEGLFGAHISVILAKEAKDNHLIGEVSELGRDMEFSITGCYSVQPDGWAGVERVWFLTIDCPELESLRQKYGLSPKINGHDYHITLAVKKTLSPNLSGYYLPIQSASNFKKIARNYV